MPQTDAPTTRGPKAPPARKPRPDAPAAAGDADLYALTVDIATGRLVGVERVDAAGERRALTAAEKAELAATHAKPVRRLFERAFEAGIECVLGNDAGRKEALSEEEGELSGLLLEALIEESGAKELAGDGALDRSVLGALLGQAAASAIPA